MIRHFFLLVTLVFFPSTLFCQAFRIDPRLQQRQRFSLNAITEIDNVLYVFFSGTPCSGLVSFRADGIGGDEWQGYKLQPPPHIVRLNTPESRETTKFYRYRGYLIAHNGANFYAFSLQNKEKPTLYRQISPAAQYRTSPCYNSFWDERQGKFYDCEYRVAIDVAQSLANNTTVGKKIRIHSGQYYKRLIKVNDCFVFEDFTPPGLHIFQASEGKESVDFHYKFSLDLRDYLGDGAWIVGHLDTGEHLYILLKKHTWGKLLIYCRSDFTATSKSALRPHRVLGFSLESSASQMYLQQLTSEKMLIYNNYNRAIVIKPLLAEGNPIVERFYLRGYVRKISINPAQSHIFYLVSAPLNIIKKNYNELIVR